MTDPEPNELPAGPKKRIDKLIAFLSRECPGLRESEVTLAQAVVVGGRCDLARDGDRTLQSESTPDDWQNWGTHRSVRAEVLRTLCVSETCHALVSDQGVHLFNARIEGELNLSGARVPFDVFLVSCVLDKPVLALSAVCRTLKFCQCALAGLTADGLRASGDLSMSHGCRCAGTVRIAGASIEGSLDCHGSIIDAKGIKALVADGAHVSGNVLLRDGFRAIGEVRLLGARIQGNLDCVGGYLDNRHGIALYADRLEASGGVLLRDGFHAKGQVRLLSARLGGQFDCNGGRFESTSGTALLADGLNTSSSVFLSNGFHATGEVRFPASRVGETLSCDDGSFDNGGGKSLNLSNTTIVDTLFMRSARFQGALDLTRSRIGALNDAHVQEDIEPNWPDQIILEDCRYDTLLCRLDAQSRLNWLANHDQTMRTYRGADAPPDPGVYRWLANVLRERGRDRDATAVMVEFGWRRTRSMFHQRRKRSNALAICRGFPAFMYGAVVGHGYAHFRPLYWIAVMWLFGAVIFTIPHGPTMQPVQGLVLREWSASTAPPPALPQRPWADLDGTMAWLLGYSSEGWLADYPRFHPVVYSLDALLPLVDFHQEEYWTPIDGPFLSWRWIVKNVYLPIHIAMGWIVATLFAASFTKLARHD
ncbi:MAG: hypothetical protein RIB58_06605 [Phycisphaerales bacterium]